MGIKPFKIVSDLKKIAMLYERAGCEESDFLLIEDGEDFDWETFASKYRRIKTVNGDVSLCESIEIISSTPEQDCYKTNHSGFELFLYINFKSKTSLDTPLLTLLSNSAKPSLNKEISNIEDPIQNPALIRDLINTVKCTKEPIIHIAFEDSDKNTHITNKFGISSLSIASSIEDILNDSIARRTYHPEVVFFEISRTEKKRKKIYQKMIKQIYGPKMNNMCTYKMSNNLDKIFIWETLMPSQNERQSIREIYSQLINGLLI